MSCKKISVGHLVCGVALSALALTPLAAQAQTGTMGGGGMGGGGMGGGMGMDNTMAMSGQPTLVTGTVLRYYVDRAGYVTAMDVQTAEGVQFVRFSPGMGQRLYTTYPVGGQASVYVMGSQAMGMNRMDVVGMGSTMPAPGTMMQPFTVTDADLLDSQPFIQAGAKMVTQRGKLTDIIVNDSGEVVGLVLNGSSMMNMKKKMMAKGMMGSTMMVMPDGRMMPVRMQDGRAMVAMTDGTSVELMMQDGKYVVPESMTGAKMMMVMPDGRQMDMDTVDGKMMVMMPDGTMAATGADGTMMMPGTMMPDTTMAMPAPGMMGGMMGGMMQGSTLVRVPREFRHISMGAAGTERVTPLFRGADVEVTGFPEAPRFGVLSFYQNRIAASALVVNGRAVGALGIPMMGNKDMRALFNNVNIGGGGRSAEELRAAGMGYTVYGTSQSMGGEPTMMTPDGTATTGGAGMPQ